MGDGCEGERRNERGREGGHSGEIVVAVVAKPDRPGSLLEKLRNGAILEAMADGGR